jgi:hypothetical protein
MYLKEAGYLGVDWNQPVKDRIQWRALVVTVTISQVP